MKSNMSLDPSMGFTESAPPPVEGIFTVRYRDGEGEWQQHFHKKNLIVDSARKVMARLVSGDASYYINQLQVGGDNTLTAAEMLSPNSPTISDTGLVYTTNQFTRTDTDTIDGSSAWTVSFPNEPNETSVLFSVTIGRDEANLTGSEPTVYLCAGLFADSGNYMFSSQSFPVITKTSERELLIEWNIRF